MLRTGPVTAALAAMLIAGCGGDAIPRPSVEETPPAPPPSGEAARLVAPDVAPDPSSEPPRELRAPATTPSRAERDARYFPKDPGSVVISLERTSCYGSCPAYVVTLRGDGTCTWNGKSNVSIEGVHEYTIDRARIVELLASFEEVDFLGLQGSFADDVKDAPSEILTLSIDGRERRLRHLWWRNGASEGTDAAERERVHALLERIAERIDAAADTSGWIGSAEERQAKRDAKWAERKRAKGAREQEK